MLFATTVFALHGLGAAHGPVVDEASFRRAGTGRVFNDWEYGPDQSWGLGSSNSALPPPASVACPLPTFHDDGRWSCPDQTLTLEQRRTMFDRMKPFDEINGVKLDDYWPATAGVTLPISENHYSFDYEGTQFVGYKLSRPTGERAPIHYHEVAQLLCLEAGKIMVMTDGQADKFYEAPDCYMMPAYTKVSVISIETKEEKCLLRVPHGGYDWIVIEPKYYDLQGQWDFSDSSSKSNDDAGSLGVAPSGRCVNGYMTDPRNPWAEPIPCSNGRRRFSTRNGEPSIARLMRQ